MMEDQNPQLSPDLSLQDRWQSVWHSRLELASELEHMADDLPGEGRKHLRSLSQWFRGPARLEDALQRPDVSAISLPLLNATTASAADRLSIDQAARMGFCSLGRNVSISRRLIQNMFYPVLVLLACLLVAILFSFFLVPQFEDMFAEFGIELPTATLAVFAFAQFVRDLWWAVFLVILAAVMVMWFLSRTGVGDRPANLSWLDLQLMSTRNALASWAWHISLLLESGVPQREALKAAGTATGNQRLRQVSLCGPR